MFSQYKWLIIAAVVGTAVASAFWYRTKAETLEKELDAANAVVSQLGDALEVQEALADRHYALMLAQRETNKALAEESRQKTNKINKYKDREQVVYKKPGLVERLEQKAMDEFMEDLTSGQ